jgi:hypothetical protein
LAKKWSHEALKEELLQQQKKGERDQAALTQHHPQPHQKNEKLHPEEQSNISLLVSPQCPSGLVDHLILTLILRNKRL